MELDPSASPVNVSTEIHFGADIIVAFDDNDDDGTVEVAPIEVKVSTADGATVPISVILGAVEFLSASAAVDMNADIKVEDYSADCGLPIGNASNYDLCFNVTSSQYNIAGGITLGNQDYGGFVIADPSTVSIDQVGLFQSPDPNVTFTGFEQEEDSIERFTLVHALGMLRTIDTTFVRTQENPKYAVNNFPFTQSVLASNVATGSFLTTRKLELFAKPKAFKLRASKSLRVTASELVNSTTTQADTTPTGVGTTTTQADTTTTQAKELELLIVMTELLANPEDTAGVRGLNQTTSCRFPYPTNVESEDQFADLLVNGINVAPSCGVTACRFESSCSLDPDSGDITGCGTCKIVVDTNAKGLLYISSVAYSTMGIENDVVLLGLYEANKTVGPQSFFGFPLNQPENADLGTFSVCQYPCTCQISSDGCSTSSYCTTKFLDSKT